MIEQSEQLLKNVALELTVDIARKFVMSLTCHISALQCCFHFLAGKDDPFPLEGGPVDLSALVGNDIEVLRTDTTDFPR